MATQSDTREVWLRGLLPDMPPLLQPVAHGLMQAREEVTNLMGDFPDELLWLRPTGRSGKPMASVGFHLHHMAGVLDRLFTYAQGELLSPEQLAFLAAEVNTADITGAELVRQFGEQVDRALVQLRSTDQQTLTELRGVGRAQLPSTVLGLYVHAAEHTMRHLGQLLVTAQVVSH